MRFQGLAVKTLARQIGISINGGNMYLRRSFSILISKFNLSFKLLMYIALVITVMAAIAVSIFMPSYNALVREVEDTDILVNAKTAFQTIIKGDFEQYSEGYDALEASYIEARDLINENVNKLYKIFIMLIVLGVAGKYLISLSYIPFVDVVNKFMHSDVEYGVMHNFVENMKKSLKFSLFNVLIMVPLDVCIVFIVGGAFSLLSSLISIFTLPFAVALAIGLYMFKTNIFAGWIPAIVYDNLSIMKALKSSFKTAKLRFMRTYMMFTVVAVFSMSFYVLFGLSTLGLGYLIGMPIILLFYRVLELVTYYNINGHRYYLDHDTIVEPRI